MVTATFAIGSGIGCLTNKKEKIETPTIENNVTPEETKPTSTIKEWKSSEVSANCRRLYYSAGLKWRDDKRCENRLKRVTSRTGGTSKQ